MQISLVGAGYWGSKLKAELETIPGVDDIEIIDIKDGNDLKDIKYDNVIPVSYTHLTLPTIYSV